MSKDAGEAIAVGCFALVKVAAFFAAVVCAVGMMAPHLGWWASAGLGSAAVYSVFSYGLRSYERDQRAKASAREPVAGSSTEGK